MTTAIVFSVFVLVIALTQAYHASESEYNMINADLKTRVMGLDVPEEQIKCIIKKASKFPASLSETGEKRFDIVRYRMYITFTLMECNHQSEAPERSESVIRYATTEPICDCDSNCHFCCVQSGALGGEQYCFQAICNTKEPIRCI